MQASEEVADLFEGQAHSKREARLMEVVDRLDGDVVWGPQMLAWGVVSQQQKRTPKFTTRWQELLRV